MQKNITNIYWSIYADEYNWPIRRLLSKNPLFFESHISFISQKEINCILNEEGYLMESKKSGFDQFSVNNKRSDKRFAIKLKPEIILFSDKLIEIYLRQPIENQVIIPDFAQIIQQSWDISKVFASIECSYLLHENFHSFFAKQNEPLFEIQCVSNEKIIFQEFRMNRALFEISKIYQDKLNDGEKNIDCPPVSKEVHEEILRTLVYTRSE